MERPPVVVVGAGPAGLATAAMLRRHGVPTVVLEQAGTVGASWTGHHEGLHLHTVRWLSHLPGYRIPRREGRWVPSSGVHRYLVRYAAHHRLDVRTTTRVQRVDRAGPSTAGPGTADAGAPVAAGAGWLLRLDDEVLPASSVVVATGYNHTPLVPDWPGAASFTGELILAADYRTGAAYRGRDVLVVGPGNTGAEIAVDLAEQGARRVRLAIRRPPYVLRRSQLGVPTQLLAVLVRRLPTSVADALADVVRRLTVPDLTRYGWPVPGRGLYTRARAGAVPVLDVGLVDAVRRRQVLPVPAVTGFDGPSVHLAGGTSVRPDVVVVAVGYEHGLRELVGHLGVLDARGLPSVHGPRTHPAAPGLYFLGYSNPPSGMLREIGIDARRIARAVARERADRPGAVPAVTRAPGVVP